MIVSYAFSSSWSLAVDYDPALSGRHLLANLRYAAGAVSRSAFLGMSSTRDAKYLIWVSIHSGSGRYKDIRLAAR